MTRPVGPAELAWGLVSAQVLDALDPQQTSRAPLVVQAILDEGPLATTFCLYRLSAIIAGLLQSLDIEHPGFGAEMMTELGRDARAEDAVEGTFTDQGFHAVDPAEFHDLAQRWVQMTGR